ncbi:unnamed protein product, partial [Protopolystoma xenopodis]
MWILALMMSVMVVQAKAQHMLIGVVERGVEGFFVQYNSLPYAARFPVRPHDEFLPTNLFFDMEICHNPLEFFVQYGSASTVTASGLAAGLGLITTTLQLLAPNLSSSDKRADYPTDSIGSIEAGRLDIQTSPVFSPGRTGLDAYLKDDSTSRVWAATADLMPKWRAQPGQLDPAGKTSAVAAAGL